MSVASFKVSVDRGLLKTMHSLGTLDSVAPNVAYNSLSSNHIEKYIRNLVNKDLDEEVNPLVIQDALKGLTMPMTISYPETRVLEYVHDVFQRLESVGYGSFRDSNPEKTVKLIQTHLFSPGLKMQVRSTSNFNTV